MTHCFKCQNYIKYAMYEHEVGDFIYCDQCAIKMLEKFMKMQKRINKWYNERWDTNHEEMATMLMKFWRLMKK